MKAHPHSAPSHTHENGKIKWRATEEDLMLTSDLHMCGHMYTCTKKTSDNNNYFKVIINGNI